MSVPDETQILAHDDQPGGNWLTNSRGYQTLLVLLLSLNFGIVFFDRQALNVLMPFVQPDLQLSGTQIGLLAGGLSFSWAIAAFFVGRLSDTLGKRKILLVLLLALIAGISIGGPGSSVGFDFPRTSLARHRLGTATGVVIMGGFVGALIAILLIGVVLDLLRPDGDYDLASFRLAFAVQLPLLAIGVVGMLMTRRNLRRRMAVQGREVPPWREVWRSGRWRQL